MTEIVATGGSEPPRVRLRDDWARRLLNELFALFVALLFLVAVLLVLLDSAPGHRFIVDQIGKLETASGLRIRIGRIDGSIFGKSQLRNVSIADQNGVFLTSPNIKLDWTPGAWLANKLHVDSVTAERVTLIRLPKLKPSTKKGPILPGFDIHIGELRIDRLDVGGEVGGVPRSGRVWGMAVCARLGPVSARFAYQSQGRSSEKWLGPTVESTIEALHCEGHRHVLIAPIGFLSDHLEVLYDIDIEFRRFAESKGMQLERIAMLNAAPALITTLASLLEEHQASLVG